MYTIISPAKTFERKLGAEPRLPRPTPPELEGYARPIIEAALGLTLQELGRDLRLSPKLAQEARHDWLAFAGGERNPQKALELYSGMVFRKIGARGFSPELWAEADTRLGICSFVYGLLRPSDGIRPYRMEGDLRLEDGRRVFDYWRDLLTPRLIERTRERSGVLIFLASEEMKQLFHWDEVERALRVITPTFMTRTPEGGLKQIVIYTKMARGEMAGSIIRERLDSPEALQTLTPADFVYQPERSSEREWIYVLG